MESNLEKDIRLRITEEDLPVTYVVKLLGKKESKGLWGIKNTREPIDSMISVAKENNLSLPVVHLKITKEGVIISPFPLKSESKSVLQMRNNNVNSTPPKPAPVKIPKVFLSTIKYSVMGIKSKNNPKHSTQNLELTPIIDCDYTEKLKQITLKNKIETDFQLLKSLKNNHSESEGFTFLGIDTISYGVQDLIFTRVFAMIVVTDDPIRNPFQCYGFVCEDRHVARCLTYALSAAFQVYSRTIKSKKPPVPTKKEKERKAKILAIDLRTPEEKSSRRKLIDSEA